MKRCQLLSRTLKAIIGDEHLIKQTKIPPEHPHSSTIDDVECFFFCILRDMVGKDFTCKEV